jgi:hypothetical protein
MDWQRNAVLKSAVKNPYRGPVYIKQTSRQIPPVPRALSEKSRAGTNQNQNPFIRTTLDRGSPGVLAFPWSNISYIRYLSPIACEPLIRHFLFQLLDRVCQLPGLSPVFLG